MTKPRIALMLLFSTLLAGYGFSQTEVPRFVGALDAIGIKSIQISSALSGYTMTLIVTLTNGNKEALRLRNGEFDVSFNRPGTGEKIFLGHAPITDQIIPGQASERPGQADVRLDINVGPRSQNTVDKMIEVINIINNPSVVLKADIQGRSEVGMQLPRGWVFEEGRKFEVYLSFTPAVQREFLLK